MFQFTSLKIAFATVFLAIFSTVAQATPFTKAVPGTGLTLPADYPEAGGVAIVMVGTNGNSYFQFSNPTGAFRGYNSNGTPTAFRGNPFTINDPIALNCGFSTCTTYFGGAISNIYIRFTAYDGDTQIGGFDENDIDLLINGFNVGNWTNIPTQNTNLDGTQLISSGTGFGNRTFDTGWFTSSNPALLSNILTTNQTVSQVLDDDPNDNYWDFRQGSTLSNNDIVTVAPGYSLEKTADKTDFLVVGEQINYDYIVTNIGSVPIRQFSLNDDKITNVTCDKTVILDTDFGGTADFATCSGLYTVVQADVDNGGVTNVAAAIGVPDFGSLGGLTDTVTVNGPTQAPEISLVKSTTLSEFGAVGTSVPYTFTVKNEGNVTLTAVEVTDPKVPSLSCSVATLAPDAEQICTANYTVKQSDIDAFATSGTVLSNTASATGKPPIGPNETATSTVTLSGATPVVSMTLVKDAITADYAAVGDVIDYTIKITNTGTVTFPTVPVITDALTNGATCPAGAIAPLATRTCLANYTVLQGDIDAGQIDNIASATITVGSLTATDTDDARVMAVRTTGLTLDKRLNASSPTSFADVGVNLVYDYVLTNTGNVTLETPTITDDKTTATCAATTIAPGAQVTCVSANYPTTQGELNANSVTNVATASANAAGTGTAVPSNSDTVTVPAVQTPAISLVKSAPAVTAGDFREGNSVTYTYVVTNTGNIALGANVGVTDITVSDNKFPNDIDCFNAPLARGASNSCTAVYTYTSDDILAGVVQNTAVASAGATESAAAEVTIAPVLTPAISLTKTADVASVASTTDTIVYTFVVTNTGDTSIIRASQPITITDAKLSAAPVCDATPTTLDPMDTLTCTGSYTPTQAELDAGTVDNAATAAFDFTQGGVTTTIMSPQVTESVPVVQAPQFTLGKTADVTAFTAVGQSIEYTFALNNTGNVTFTEITVTDPLIPALSCTLTDVAPLATPTCTGIYVVTQADMDAEIVNNEASAAGQTASGAGLTKTAQESVIADPTFATTIASIAKTANLDPFTAVGEVITYTLAVTNDGTQTLNALTVTDALDPSYTCNIVRLLPTQTSNICTLEYTVTQADLDVGQIDNAASVAGAQITTDTALLTIDGPARTSSFNFAKTADAGFTVATDPVAFTFAVTNTGNTTLTDVTVTDTDISPALNCVIPSILPGDTDATTCTATYTVTQTDVDNGTFTNTATAAVTAPAGVIAPANKTSTAVVAGPAEAARVTITKSATDGVYSSAADSEVYTFSVTNTGNVTLTGLTVADPAAGNFSCALDDLLPGATTTTCTGGAALTATKNFAQSDIDLASFTNTATVTGQSLAQATAVSDNDMVTVTGPVQNPQLSMTKVETLGVPFTILGQDIPYAYVVTNAGNITLTGPITVVDDQIAAVRCDATPPAGIAPLGTLNCVGIHEVTQADLDAGEIINNATASVTQSVVAQTVEGATIVTATSPGVTETILAGQDPKLSIDKRVKSTSAASYANVNDIVTFEYVVTNAGNVTLTEDILINDDKVAGSLICSTADLAPLGTVTCEQDWTADQIALNDGEVTNIATADTTHEGNAVQSPTDSVTVPAVQDISLALLKTLVAPIPTTFDEDDVLTYKFVVTNNGTVTIDGPITIADSITTATCDPTPAGGLVPNASLECDATYTIVSGDLELGSTTNVATASGTFDGNPVTSPSSSTLFPVTPTTKPALSIAKALTLPASAEFAALNDVLTYEFTVTNSGGAGFTEAIFVNDNKIGSFTCVANTTDVFNVNEVAVCTNTYTVTQDDLDAGFVTNEATASTEFGPLSGSPFEVVSQSDTVTVDAATSPALSVTKSVTSGPNTALVGNTLEYTIVTTNTGNQTISGISVTDPRIPAFACEINGATPASNVILTPNAPNDVLTCVGSYTVTQADIDAQDALNAALHVLPNTATATGTNPQGGKVEISGSNTHPLDEPLPSVGITKTLDKPVGPDDDFSAVGEELTFVIAVENTGNVTLTNTEITDSLLVAPQTCTIGSLAPGDTDDSCVVVYTVTQDDFDTQFGAAGLGTSGVLNTATATSTPISPNAVDVTNSDDELAVGPERIREFTLGKSADLTEITTVGQIVTYTYVVANSGNVTLIDQPFVDDDKIGIFACGTMPAGGLLPLEVITCTQPYTVTAEDMDFGSLTNVASVTSDEVLTPVSATVTLDAVQDPMLTLTKVSSATSDVVVGQVVTYTYTVSNTGNVTMSNAAVTDQHTSAAGTVALSLAGDTLLTDAAEQGTSTDAAANGSWDILGAGDVVTFTAQYTVTQADIDEQVTIANTATLNATDPDGTLLPPVVKTVEITVSSKTPSYSVSKTGNATGLSDPVVIGDTVTFEITVANTGNQTITDIMLDDDLTSANGAIITLSTPILTSGDTDGDTDLDVGETHVFTASYTLEQVGIDAGGVENTVTVTGTDPQNTPLSETIDTPVEIDIPRNPVVALIKTLALNDGGDGVADAGDIITYTYTVSNEGNVTLYDAAVAETTFSGTGMTPSLAYKSGGTAIGQGVALDIAVGAAPVVFEATYALTQADVDAGEITNQATVTVNDPDGTPVTDLSDDDSVNGADETALTLAVDAALEVVKTAMPNLSSPLVVGDTIAFTITAENTGNVTLTNITLNDTFTDENGQPLTLTMAPTYDSGDANSDSKLDATETWTYLASFTLTQDAIDAGGVSNTATVTGTLPQGGTIDDVSNADTPNGSTPTDVTLTRNPVIAVVKTASVDAGADGIVNANDVITYTYTISNEGNVTLYDASVSETTFSGSDSAPTPVYQSGGTAIGQGAALDIAVGAGPVIFEATYTLTQADVDAGGIENQATALANDPDGTPITDLSDDDSTAGNDTTSVTIAPIASLDVVKMAATSLSTPVEVGDQITYTITVENTGNVTLDAVAPNDTFTRRDGTVLTLALGSPAGDGGVTGDLEPTETWTYTATYALLQADIDAGGVNNTVTVAAQTPANTPVSDTSDDGDDTDNNTTDDPTEVRLKADPDLSIVKRLPTGAAATYAALNEEVVFEFDVTNSGNITITGAVQINDPLITAANGAISCAPSPIAVGGSILCTGNYFVTQDDLDNGSFENVATATVDQPVVPFTDGDPTTVGVESNAGAITLSAAQDPKIAITKAVKTGAPLTYAAPDDQSTFVYTVTNTGNVTLTADVSVFDDKIPGTLSCGGTGLAPGDSVTCEQVWTAVLQDLNDGSVTNTATAQTTFGGNTVDQDLPATATVTALQNPSLLIDKSLVSAVPNVFNVDTVLSYDFLITNNGNVTIAGPFTVSDNLSTVSCPAVPAELDPTQTTTCTSTYSIRQVDLDLGSTVNVAAASGIFGTETVTSPTDSDIYPVADDVFPALSLTKDSVPSDATFALLGDTIDYTYTLTNSGKTGFNTDIEITDNRFVDPIPCYIDTPTGTFGVGESLICTAQYVVVQADLDAEFVINEATASTIFAPNTANEILVVSPAVTKKVDGVEDPELTVLKSVTDGPNPAIAGATLEYTITVENTGNQTITNVTVVDPLIPVLTCEIAGNPAPAIVVMAPLDVLTCVGTYDVTQTDVNNQNLVNTAKATGADPQGDAVLGTVEVIYPLIDPVSALIVTKAIQNPPATGPVFTQAGETIRFVISLFNNGNVTLNNLEVSDSLTVTPQTCSLPTLAPQATNASCVVTYVTTQADVDALNAAGGVTFGGFTNVATATAVPANPNATPLSETGDVFVQGPDRAVAFAIEKTADASSIAAFGESVTYTYTITNTGNVTLYPTIEVGNVTVPSQPTVTDDKISNVICEAIPAAGMAPNGTLECSAVYAVTQADVDSGGVTNIASVASTEVPLPSNPGDAQTSLTVPSVRASGITLDKAVVGTPAVTAGETITYLYTATNTGNVTLTDVAVTDQHTSAAGTSVLPIAGDTLLTDVSEQGTSIDAGANGSWDILGAGDVATFTATYLVTQADIDAQNDLSNTATVTTNAPNGVTPPTDMTTVDLSVAASDPALTTVKTVQTAGLSSPPIAGETITFTISVDNSGNQTLDTVTLIDTLKRADGTTLTLTTQPTYMSGDAGVIGNMETTETWIYTATYTLTQADVDAGGVSNSVLSRAITPDNSIVTDVSDNNNPADGDNNPTRVQIPASPAITGAKVVTSTTTDVGETVDFEITITNAGNVTLRSVAVATDTLLRADGTPLALTSGPIFISSTAASGAGVLLPNEIATYAATYTLTQDDIDAGGIANSAVVTGTPPAGTPITDDTQTATVTVASEPVITLVKRLPDGASPTYSAVGEVVNYVFDATNAGNVTLNGPFSITDPLITNAGGTITCEAGPIAPTDSIQCIGAYAITQADLDLGTLTNIASATDGSTTSDDATLVVPASQRPAIAIVKTAESVAATDFVPTLQVSYTYVATNTGNITLEDPITISDNLIDASNITCPVFPAAGIAPNGTYTCTGIYSVTSDDVDLGSVTNLASGSDGITTSPLVSETIPEEGVPALSLVKTAEIGATFAEIDDQIDYTFTVTNTGTRAFVNDVIVYDDRLGEITCFTQASPTDAFAAGDVATCTATDTVTQTDLDAGFVTNEAYAQTIFGIDDTPTTSAPVSQTVDADLSPEISLAKTSTPNPVTVVGETLTYTLIATNDGNQTLRNINVTDPLLPALSCAVPELLRGASHSCTAPYIVTQVDIDRGELVNTAAVRAITPQGTAVSGIGTEVTVMPASAPAMTLVKSASPDPFSGVGSSLSYLFTVSNTGNTTLLDLTVTDVLDPSFSCTIAAIAPGKTNRTCSFVVQITQDHVDAGEIENTGSVSGSDPFGTPITRSDVVTTAGPAQMPSLNVTKVVLPSASALGSQVNFQLLVENTGNVTLTPQVPVDTMTRSNGTSITLDAPFAVISGDADNDGKIDVTETWTYAATRTLVQGDLNAGGLINSATVNVVGPNGDPASDTSDNGNDGDGNTTDDATVFDIVREPQLTVTKTAVSDGAELGDNVTFTIVALNTGNVTLTDLTVADTLSRTDGSIVDGVNAIATDVPAGLSPGEPATWTVIHVITQDDIDAGGLSNSATVTGTDPTDETVSDMSSDDDYNDGNIDSDPTEISIASAPAIEVIKTVDVVGVSAGEDVVFEITVQNTGNVTLTNVGLTDTMTNDDGTVVTPVRVTFFSADGDIPSPEGTLMVGEIATYTAAYTLTLADVNSGGLTNTATGTGTTPQGANLSDVSDNGTGTGDTPTRADISSAPDLEVVKSASDVYVLFPTVEQVTFTITVTNTGNVTQTGLQVVDDLAIYSAPATLLLTAYPTMVSASGFTDGTASATYDGVTDTNTLTGNATLEPGETGTITIVSTYSAASAYPASDNTAQASSTELPEGREGTSILDLADSDGDGIPDSLEGDGDRDGDGIPDNMDYDPTGYFYCEEDGRILSGGRITVVGNGSSQTGVGTTGPITIVQDGSNGFFQFYATQAGTYTIVSTYPTTGVPSQTRTSSGTLNATTLLPNNPASIGSSEFGDTGVLADYTQDANVFYTVIEVEAGDPYVINNNIPLMNCASAPNVLATKKADRDTVVMGETVNYTLTFVNNTSRTFADAAFVDMLPAGMLYTPGTGTVDGALTEPVVTARRVTWGGLTIVPTQIVTITMAARVTSAAVIGPMTNQAWLEDATGTMQSNIAIATVQLQPEPVFDCSDVIGTVFDDRNNNGYQDGAPDISGWITDQTYDGSKNQTAPEATPITGEPGLPNVRIVSTDGTIIYTDAYGRFSVPCAALPRDSGSNYTLKVDTRTLPTGYQMTTENPRVMRLTAGKMAKMNFGTSLSNIVDIDLTAAAFVAGSVAPSGALETAVDNLLASIAEQPAALRLTYVMTANDQIEGARARLRAVEDMVRRKWRSYGRYSLTIERTLKQGQ